MEREKFVILVLHAMEKIISEETLDKIKPLFLNCLANNYDIKQLTALLLPLASALPASPAIIAQTLFTAHGRMHKYTQACLGEVKHFRYAPDYANPLDMCYKFCSKKVGKTYTIKQIMKMNNKHSLSVIFFCGGLGCTHDWEPNPFADIGIK